jgi:hypothetical protein
VYRNGTQLGTSVTANDTDKYVYAYVNGTADTAAVEYNFGQQSFVHTPPTGYSTLSTANLPEPAISPADDESPTDYFNTVLYTGNGGTNSVTGVGFKPDFVWIKSRSQNEGHRLYDAVRGVQKMLFTNGTGAELTSSLTSFDTDGFTLTGNTYSENTSGSS